MNEQYNSVISSPDPTMTIKHPKDFFGHPQGNTLSDIKGIQSGVQKVSYYCSNQKVF